MNETHISYKCAKALKEFMGENAPEPMEDNPLAYYGEDLMHYVPAEKETEMHRQIFNGFAYQLHDLLSKEFCEAIGPAIFNKDFLKMKEIEREAFGVYMSKKIWSWWYDGGLPAVEAELFKMMEGK